MPTDRAVRVEITREFSHEVYIYDPRFFLDLDPRPFGHARERKHYARGQVVTVEPDQLREFLALVRRHGGRARHLRDP